MLQMEKRGMPEQEVLEARKLYQELYSKALPHAGSVALDDIEIASYNIAVSLDDFKKVGLGLKVIVIHSYEYAAAKTSIGHTGKVLMNLPWQVLLEHSHADVDVLPAGTAAPEGYVLVKDIVNGFYGIKDYNDDGTPKVVAGEQQYRYLDIDYAIMQSTSRDSRLPSEMLDSIVHHFEGKSETFKMICGDALLFSDEAVVLSSPVDANVVPDRFRHHIYETRSKQVMTTTKMIYLAPGSEVLLPKHTKHALLAGEEGAVYLEFSTPSLDEADVFSDERVIR